MMENSEEKGILLSSTRCIYPDAKVTAVNGTALLLRPAMKKTVGGIVLSAETKAEVQKDKDAKTGLEEPNWLTVLAIDEFSMPGVSPGDQVILDEGDVAPCKIGDYYCVLVGLHMVRLVKRKTDEEIERVIGDDKEVKSFMVDATKLFDLDQLSDVMTNVNIKGDK